MSFAPRQEHQSTGNVLIQIKDRDVAYLDEVAEITGEDRSTIVRSALDAFLRSGNQRVHSDDDRLILGRAGNGGVTPVGIKLSADQLEGVRQLGSRMGEVQASVVRAALRVFRREHPVSSFDRMATRKQFDNVGFEIRQSTWDKANELAEQSGTTVTEVLRESITVRTAAIESNIFENSSARSKRWPVTCEGSDVIVSALQGMSAVHGQKSAFARQAIANYVHEEQTPTAPSGSMPIADAHKPNNRLKVKLSLDADSYASLLRSAEAEGRPPSRTLLAAMATELVRTGLLTQQELTAAPATRAPRGL